MHSFCPGWYFLGFLTKKCVCVCACVSSRLELKIIGGSRPFLPELCLYLALRAPLACLFSLPLLDPLNVRQYSVLLSCNLRCFCETTFC